MSAPQSLQRLSALLLDGGAQAVERHIALLFERRDGRGSACMTGHCDRGQPDGIVTQKFGYGRAENAGKGA
jgi:hypothetical protein